MRQQGCRIDSCISRVLGRAVTKLISNSCPPHSTSAVNLDDCWQVDRTSSGLIVPDPVRFPSGIASVADRIHALGLKFGVYTAANQYTCQVRPRADSGAAECE